jgi:hypothetical protein
MFVSSCRDWSSVQGVQNFQNFRMYEDFICKLPQQLTISNVITLLEFRVQLYPHQDGMDIDLPQIDSSESREIPIINEEM